MSNACHDLVSFVLRKLPAEPLADRVRLYRAAADVEPNDNIARRLREIADDLAGIERQHSELQLDFQNELNRPRGIARAVTTEAGR